MGPAGIFMHEKLSLYCLQRTLFYTIQREAAKKFYIIFFPFYRRK